MKCKGARRRRVLRLQAILTLACLAGCMSETPADTGADTAGQLFSAAYGSESDAPRRLFISGHSLTNRPFPDYLAELAAASGSPLDWDMQYLEGSSLRMRTRGSGTEPWQGYLAGRDRNDQPADARQQLALGAATNPYDTLILNEVHTLLESLIWNDTIGNALDYEARFSAINPAGQTYLYAAWLDVDDLNDPRRWIAYERDATRAWQCTALRINQALADKGASRRVRLIPAAEGLAAMVEQAVSAEGLPGVSGPSKKATMRRIFTDSVHLTDMGNYYVALLSFIALYGELPDEPWEGKLEPATAKPLQNLARQFMTGWKTQQAEVRINCAQFLADEFSGTYLGYVRDTKWREGGTISAYYKWARFSIQWPRLLRSDSERNPFRNKVASGHQAGGRIVRPENPECHEQPCKASFTGTEIPRD